MQLVKACQAEGLPGTGMYHPEPLYRQPVFFDHASGAYRIVRCPVAEDLTWKSAIGLDHWLLLGSKDDMHQIVEIIRKVKTYAAEVPPVGA